MIRIPKATMAAAALAMAAPAAAQTSPVPPPPPGEPPTWKAPPPPPGEPAWQAKPAFRHVLRANLGVGFYNSGWYDCYYYYPYTGCGTGSYTEFIPFLAGAQVDYNLRGASNLSLGFTANMGTVTTTVFAGTGQQSRSKSVTVWEPTVDYVAKYGPPTQDTQGRFRIGGAMYFAPSGAFGGGFRIGGGVSLLNTRRFGVGLDFVFEGGWIEGYWVGGLQLVASPEIHF